MKIYISGPINGQCNYVDRFAAAEELLRSGGYDVVNPTEDAELKPNMDNYIDRSFELLKDCDGIYMLEGWEESAEASTEFEFAKEHKLTICFEVAL